MNHGYEPYRYHQHHCSNCSILRYEIEKRDKRVMDLQVEVKKLRKYMDEIKTTDTKLNGRLNPDTVLLKVI